MGKVKSKILHIDYNYITENEFQQRINKCYKLLIDLLIKHYNITKAG